MSPIKRHGRTIARIGGWTIVALGAALLLIGPFHLSYGSFDHRNGAAEAMDDVAAGMPIKLYSYDYAEIGPNIRTPGLYCPANSRVQAFWAIKRIRISEAAFAEGRTLAWLALRRATSARAFAYLYNTTIFDTHRGELNRMCPGLKLEPYQPELKSGG